MFLGAFTLSSAMAAGPTCDEWIQKVGQNAGNVNQLEILLPKLPELEVICSNPELAEKEIMDALWKLEQRKRLDSALLVLVKNIKAKNKIPQLANVPEEFAVATLGLAIRSEFYDRGYYNPSFVFAGWDKITKEQEETLSRLPRVSSFRSEGFKAIFKRLTNMPMTSISNVKVLEKNSEALTARLNLIKNAKNTIKFMTWGFYDDNTGKQVSDELIAAVNRNVRVQVIVDGLVAQRPGYKNYLSSMKNAGVEIVFWKSNQNPFYGMHSKMLVVDDLYCIEGGRNIGKYYLEDGKWSDLDIYFEGAIAEAVNPAIFAQLWNEQVNLQRLSYEKLPVNSYNLPTGNTGTFISEPQSKVADKISNVTIYAIMNAKREIEIANAYYIATPGIKNALINAIKRGVRVKIYSNSMKSVDEPIVSIPMQMSLNEMFKAGAEIYIKVGETLHNKTFRADDLSWVGSYNLHPRSARYELEKVTVTTDPVLTAQLNQSFKNSLRQAKRVTSIEELQYPQDPSMDLLFKMIFNQL